LSAGAHRWSIRDTDDGASEIVILYDFLNGDVHKRAGWVWLIEMSNPIDVVRLPLETRL
jgi:hypothetical protein